MIERECGYCGLPIGPYAKRFCSRGCANRANKSKLKIARVCAICGGGFEVFPSVVKKGHGKYCSRTCKDAGNGKIAGNNLGLEDVRRWHITDKGYVEGKAKKHPLASKGGQVIQHWHNFWEAHGRADWVIKAKKMGASIHHRNGKRDDNDPENLEIRWPGHHPRGWTTEAMIETLEMMGYEVRAPL